MIKTHRSNFGEKFNQPEIVISAPDEFSSAVTSFFDFLSTELQRGVQFRPGETLQVGWMILLVKSLENGDVELWEPDFESFPIKWVNVLDRTFRHMYLQREICAQISVEPLFPSLLQIGVMSSTFPASEAFSICRDPVAGNDSGWIFRSDPRDSAGATYRSLFEVAIYNKRVIPFLALPEGAKVNCRGDVIEIKYKKITVTSKDNGFLGEVIRGWSPNSGSTLHH